MTAHMNRMYKRAFDWSKFKPGVGNVVSGAITALMGGYIGNLVAGTKGMIAGGLGGGALGYGGYSAVDALLSKADKPNYAAMPYIRNPEANYKLDQFLAKHPDFKYATERIRKEYERKVGPNSKAYKELLRNFTCDQYDIYWKDYSKFLDVLGILHLAEGGDEYVRLLANALEPGKAGADNAVAHAKRIADGIKLMRPMLDYEPIHRRAKVPIPHSVYNGRIEANRKAYKDRPDILVDFLNSPHAITDDDAGDVGLLNRGIVW